jgi:inorganic pyrophosphatase
MDTSTNSQSFELAKPLLNKEVKVIVDRPLGTKHPKWNFPYETNYGYIQGTMAPDGEELDAYILLVNEPVSEFTGKVVAVIHRLNDDDDKLVVIPSNMTITDEQIDSMTAFMEKWFKHVIVRA